MNYLLAVQAVVSPRSLSLLAVPKGVRESQEGSEYICVGAKANKEIGSSSVMGELEQMNTQPDCLTPSRFRTSCICLLYPRKCSGERTMAPAPSSMV